MIISASRRFPVVLCALALSAHAESPFTLGPEFSAGEQPWGCIVGDIYAGGAIDLAVANYDVPGYATILVGNGAGGFVTVTQPAINKAPKGLAAADFNSDGKLDLVVSSVSNDAFDTVSVMLGNGNATFSAPVEYEVGGFPFFVKAPDLNNDGKPDIVVPSGHQNMISVLLGVGDGTFAPRVDYPLGFSPTNVFIKDVNGDGFGDVVAAANSFFAAFAILKGVGDGTFLPPEFYGENGFYFSLAVDDFNRDGHMDVALLNRAAPPALMFSSPTILVDSKTSNRSPSIQILAPLRRVTSTETARFSSSQRVIVEYACSRHMRMARSRTWERFLAPMADMTS